MKSVTALAQFASRAAEIGGRLKGLRMHPAPFAAIVAAGALSAAQPLDADLWIHLNTGKYLAQTGRLPVPDPFSYGAAGAVWTPHEWLSEWLIYVLVTGVGVWAAAVFVGALAALTWLIVERTLAGYGASPWVRMSAIVAGAAATAPFGGIRPLQFGLLATALVASTAMRWRRQGGRGVWLLPPVFLGWANVHASFALGFGVVLAVFADALWSRIGLPIPSFPRNSFPTPIGVRESRNSRHVARLAPKSGFPSSWWRDQSAGGPAYSVIPAKAGIQNRDESGGPTGRWSAAPGSLREFAAAGAVSAVAIVANPSGPALWLHPFWQATVADRRFNSDWNAPELFSATWWAFAAFLVWVGAGLLLGRLRVAPVLLAAIAVLLAFGYDARKTMAFSAVAVPILMAGPLAQIPAIAKAVPPLLTRLVAAVAAGTALGLSAGFMPKSLDAGAVVPMPLGAVSYLKGARSERIWNTYHWGGYLTWELWPDSKVNIDGRYDLFVGPLLRDYLTVLGLGANWLATLQQGDPNAVVVEAGSALVDALKREPAWNLAYADDVAVVFIRA